MSVRKRRWRDKQGRQHEKWMIHIEHTWPDGRKQTIRKVSPVQTKRGAEQYERQLRLQLVSGQWKEDAKKIPTLAEFAEEFLDYQKTLNKASGVALKQKMLRLHLLPAFGKLRLDQIDERKVDAYKVKKLEHVTPRGKTMDPQTINLHLKLLGRMLRVARKWKLITELPDIGMLKARKPNFDFLDFEETKLFLAYAAEHEPRWHPYVVVAVRTGLRVGEMLALRWREDIDLDRGRLRVQQAYSHTDGFTTPKNDKARELPLTWDACEALRVQRSRVTGELVFPSEDGSVLSSHVTNYALRKIGERSGLRRIHNHVLRHTFASHAVMRGVPMRQVQEWMGHSSIVVTMRYAHLAEGLGDELIQRLAPSPQHGAQPRRRAARSQHMHGTGKRTVSNSAPQGPAGRLILFFSP
ncbi:MAG: tyrosine-type recombinase/integrase [Enhygromyxa sp.]